MYTTSHLQKLPDYNLSPNITERREQTNNRYSHFQQTHFTAGDEEQFNTYRYDNYIEPKDPIVLDTRNLFCNRKTLYWDRYKNVSARNVIETFRYLFYTYKKGIFVKIVDNVVKVFLPFSNVNYTNRWAHNIKIDPKYKDLFDFIRHINHMEGRRTNYSNINNKINTWFCNNFLVRYEYPISESDTNIACIKNMLDELCKNRDIPDIEFFINKRDFPVIKKNLTEAYNHVWNGSDVKMSSHVYEKYVPILSMVSADEFADVAIPTHDDWAHAEAGNKYFKNSRITGKHIFKTEWNSKIPVAIFRGSSTGTGTTIDTNTRLKACSISQTNRNILDAGITKWNLRPKKFQDSDYLQTIDINSMPFGLVSPITPEDQSNYKYILHIDGHVSSFRLTYELGMNSVVLIVESEYKVWYSNMLIPNFHYVPVKKDLSDLVDKINWCITHDDECKIIAINAKLFQTRYLFKEGIYDFLQKTLVDLKSHCGEYSYPRKRVLEIQTEDEIKVLNEYSAIHPQLPEGLGEITSIPTYARSYGMLEGLQHVINFLPDVETSLKHRHKLFESKLSAIAVYDFYNHKIVVKSTEDPVKRIENIHEAFVATTCINHLSEHIPNFVFIFGIHGHVEATHSTTRESSICKTFAEYIQGKTLLEYISSKAFDIQEYILILLQLCLALRVAQQKYCFVHNDLTPWNIVLRRLETPIKVDYIVDNKIIRVTTRVIPMIIDYGKSHVVFEGRHYGMTNNMFKFSSCMDILYILLTTVHQIITTHRLHGESHESIVALANFISETGYCKHKFKSISTIKDFFQHAKKFSVISISDKHELENKTPIDLYNYILSAVPHAYKFDIEQPTIFEPAINCDSNQVFTRSFLPTNSLKLDSARSVIKQAELIDFQGYDYVSACYELNRIITIIKFYGAGTKVISKMQKKIKNIRDKTINFEIPPYNPACIELHSEIFLDSFTPPPFNTITDIEDVSEMVDKIIEVSKQTPSLIPQSTLKLLENYNCISNKIHVANVNTLRYYATIYHSMPHTCTHAHMHTIEQTTSP